MSDEFESLYRSLGYRFKQVELLQKALTHRSISNVNNERLEFLGDSILNFVIAELLWQRFPDATEGQLSRVRAHLVKGETLTDIASELAISDFLRVGHGEKKNSGKVQASLLANAVEAIIAAIYLDIGLDVCADRIAGWYQTRLVQVDLGADHKDPKTRLQELAQARKLSLPIYTIKKTEGDPHQQTFYIECRLDGLSVVSLGKGSSRRRAEQDAAEHFLKTLQDE